MYNSSTLPFELGTTLKGTDADGNLINAKWEGAIFEVIDPRSGAKGEPLIVMVVRNLYVVASVGTALLGKRYGILKTDGGRAYTGSVIGYAPTLAAPHAVAIDDQLPSAGVAYKDLFYVILKGYHTVLTDNAGTGFNGDIAAGAALVAATAAGSTTSVAGRVSNVTLPGQTGATASFNAARNLLATALSARTTGETSADLLTYVRNSVLV